MLISSMNIWLIKMRGEIHVKSIHKVIKMLIYNANSIQIYVDESV